MNTFHAGFGRAVITPPMGTDLTGFIARENPATEVHDDIYARAFAAEADGERLLILSLECLGLDAWLYHRIRDRVAKAAGVRPDHITFSCTHTHSGPATVSLFGCGRLNRTYLSGAFTDAVERAARDAVEALAPAKAFWSVADAREWHLYRRATDKGPSDEGLVDHRIKTLWIESPSGKPTGCLWFYTAHPTILCLPAVSGDWAGEAARKLEAETGGCALFIQGCAGDVSPLGKGEGWEGARATGQGVAEAALSSRKGAQPIVIDTLSARTASVNLPLQEAPSREWFQNEEREFKRQAEAADPGVHKRVVQAMAAWAHEGAMGRIPKFRKATLQAVRIGPANLAALPFETLSAVGGEILKQCAEPAAVMSYANGCHSYLARAPQYAVGGYEIDQAYKYYGMPATYAPEAAEKVIDTVYRLMGEDNRGQK